MGFIYKITNNINGKVYIGQTIKTIKKRWQQHICNSSKPYFQQIVLYKAMKKYGKENFYIEPIEEIDNSQLDEREKYWIKYYNSYKNGYNSTIGGKATTLYELDEEQIIFDYYNLKTARKVAKKYNVDHAVIDGILNAHNIPHFSQRQYNGQRVKCFKDGIEYSFDSIVDCAQFLIDNDPNIKTKKVHTAKQYISDIINNRPNKPTTYYGWNFCKE